MKIIIANGGFYPAKNYGGPVVSIDNLCTFLANEVECYVLCTDHELGSRERLSGIQEGWNQFANCKVQYLSDANVNTKTLTKIIDEIKPDAIYINSLFDAMWTLPLLKIAKSKYVRTLLAPRGQLCKNALIGKYKKIPYIWFLKVAGLLGNVQFQSTSAEETETIKKYLNGNDNTIHFLTNLPSLPQNTLAHPQKASGKAKFVFYSRIVPKKNLISAIKYFATVNGKAEFDIYGPIEDQEYWDECQKEISILPSNVVVNYKGVIEHSRVFEVLSGYDAFLFPTWSENFGHVISEALFSGCPSIISDQTPWRQLNESFAGWDLALNDDDGFKKAIQTIVDWDDITEQRFREGAVQFAFRQFDLDKLKEQYIQALLG